MARIRFERVTKQFRDVPVVTNLDLTIEDGEFFTFLGPSGCGKSTVLNLIAGLETVTRGALYFDEMEVNDLSPRERDVAMVFQSYALYPHMTVYENIAFPLRMRKVKKDSIDTDVRRIASLLGLEGLLGRKPKELSGGQRQRVALGRAIVRRPRVFLMDEPLSNLDARLRIETRGELKRLHRELGITTVYVTHDQTEALSLSDRIAVLHEGSVQQCGTPAEVYLKPANLFVAGFIGSPSMNKLAGLLELRDSPVVACSDLSFVPEIETLPEAAGEVIVGIRPEDIVFSEKQSKGTTEATISLVEPAGSFNWVDAVWRGQKITGKSSLESTLEIGGRAYVTFPSGRIMVFDRETGKRL